MQRKVIISPLNQYRFVFYDEVLPEKFNQLRFDSALFFEQLQSYNPKVHYYQKVQKSDPLRIQVWTNNNINQVILRLYDCEGQQVGTFDYLDLPTGMPTIIEDGSEYFVNTIHVNDYWADKDGVYYLLMEFYQDPTGNAVEYIVSEPIFVKEKHPETMLLEYSNSFNKDYVIFEQTRQKFCFRVEGAIINPQPKVKRVVFTDQGENTVPLSATAYRTRVFAAGMTGGIPFWVVDKLNHIYALDSIYHNGEQLTPVEGAELAYQEPDPLYPLYDARIELADTDNGRPYQFTKGGLTLIQQADSFPFVLFSVEIGYPNNIDYFNNVPIRIANQTALDAWITARNLEIVAAGMTGQIAMENESLVYNLGSDENYSFANCVLLRYRIGMKQTTSGVSTVNPQIYLSARTGEAPYVVCNPLLSIVASGHVGEGEDLLPVPVYNAPAGGVHTFEVWHDSDNIDLVGSLGANFSGWDKYGGLPGNLPRKLARVSFGNSTRLLSFDLWQELKEVRNYLERVFIINNSNLTTLGPNGFYLPDFSVTGPEPGFPLLKFILLQGNHLSSAQVDIVFISLGSLILEQQWITYDGIVALSQLPAAPPGPSSSLAIDELENTYSFDVLHD